MDGVVKEAEFRAVTMLSKLACVSFIFSSDGCIEPVVMLRICCFLVSDEGEKFGVGEARIVHISHAVRFWHQCYIQACGSKKDEI